MGTEHKPCPFCGASDENLMSTAKAPGRLVLIGYVTCMSCGAEGPTAQFRWEDAPSDDLMTNLDAVKQLAWKLWDGEER